MLDIYSKDSTSRNGKRKLQMRLASSLLLLLLLLASHYGPTVIQPVQAQHFSDGSKAPGQAWLLDNQREPDQDQPILIKSVHTGHGYPSLLNNRSKSDSAHKRPSPSSHIAQAYQPRPDGSTYSLDQEHRPPSSTGNQEARIGLHYPLLAQPSQDFDSNSNNNQSSAGRFQSSSAYVKTTSNNWPANAAAKPTGSLPKNQPARDYYGINAGPEPLPVVDQPEQFTRESQELSSNELHHGESPGSQQWMHSVRDNHNGQLRSRFNLTASVGRPASFLFDGHMKAKSGGQSAVPYEQQAKTVRHSMSEASADGASRRNSKFTRRETSQTQQQADGESANVLVTSNQHSGKLSKATNKTSVSIKPAIPTTTTTTSQPELINATRGEEPATGNGHVEALDETDLLLLSQKLDTMDFETDSSKRIISNSHTNSSVRSKTARRMFMGDESEVRRQLSGSWSRILQRALSSVFRRLTGSNTQQPVQQQQAVSMANQQQTMQQAAAVAASMLQYQQQQSPFAFGPFLPSGLPPNVPMMEKEPGVGNSLNIHKNQNKMQQQLLTGSSLQHETRQPPKQHANKKIIDSFIDLPASERRMGEAPISEELKAEPRRKRRSSKTSSEWKELAEGEEETAYEPVEFYHQEASKDKASMEGELESEPESVDSETQLDYRTTTSGPRRMYKSDSVVDLRRIGEDSEEMDEESADDGDLLTTADSNHRENLAPDEGYSLSIDGEEPIEELRDEEPELNGPSQLEEPQQIFFYAPESSLLPTRPASLRRVTGGIRGSFSNHKPPRNPSRRPPSLFADSNHDGGPEELTFELRPVHRPSWRPPTSKPQRSKPVTVPPISLRKTKPFVNSNDNVEKSPAVSPLSIFQGPKVENNGKEMMSPMSSSINVMDLDPSMTRLAHNKLIVARFKPSRLTSQRPPQPQEMRVNKPKTTTTTTPEAPLEPKQASEHSTVLPLGLTSALLGTQAITNNHINEIINRWTKPSSIMSTTARPLISNSWDNSTRSVPDSTGLRLMNELQSLMPFASSLAARFSFPAVNGGQRSSSTTTKPPSNAAAAEHSADSSNGFRNDKFNFSLVQMNNRERINPLLFPVDQLNRHGFGASGQQNSINSANKLKNNVRGRIPSSTLRPFLRPTGQVKLINTTTTTTTTTSTTTTTTTTTTPPPPSSSSTTTTTTTSTTTASPAPSTEAEAENEAIGQTLRSQHQTSSGWRKQTPHWSLVRANAASLLNQHGSSTPPSTTLAASWSQPEEQLSGHISLVETNSMAASQSPSNNQGKLEEVHPAEANRYQLDTASLKQQELADQSVLVLNDNHHQKRRRPPGSANMVTRPFAGSMWYSSQQALGVEEDTPVATTPTHEMKPLNQASMALKYLEEFVNGSRIRPSSAYKTTPEPTVLASGKSEMVVITSNHNSNNSREFPATRKNATAAYAHQLPADSNQQASGEITMSKLDERAHELLLDIFDRDPAYSDSFGLGKESGNGSESYSDFHKATADRLRNKIYQLQGAEGLVESTTQPADNDETVRLTHYTLAENLLTTTTTTIGPETSNSQNEDRAITEASVEGFSSSNSGNDDLTKSTGGPTGLGSSSSRLQEQANSDNPSKSDTEFGIPDASSSRASMRKNQAKIQAILMALAANKAANKNRNNQHRKPTEEPSLSEELSEMDRQLNAASHLLTTSTATTSTSRRAESSSSDNDEPTSDNNFGTTRFYTPTLTSTTLASLIPSENSQPGGRYPNVETISSSRQKINRPTANGGFAASNWAGNGIYSPATPPTLAPITSTTKLTESPTSDDQLKVAIRDRLSNEGKGSATLDESSVDPEGDDMGKRHPGEQSIGDIDDRRELVGSRPQELNHQDHLETTTEIPSTDANENSEEYYSSRKPQPRPIIIRRRPQQNKPPKRRPTTVNSHFHAVRPAQSGGNRWPPNKLTVATSYEEVPDMNESEDGAPIPPKRRRHKPAKRPSTMGDGLPIESMTMNSIFEDPTSRPTSGGLDGGNISIAISDSSNLESSLTVAIGGPRRPEKNKNKLVRKKPAKPRIPPNNIRIHAKPATNLTTSQQPYRKPARGQPTAPQPISIILPHAMESIIKRKQQHQDVRTRPLTIMDPVTEAPVDIAYNETIVNPSPLTKIPETTIMHNKMVVSYKPGRPLPGQMNGFGTIGHPSRDVSGNMTLLVTTPALDQPATASTLSTFGQASTKAQLGSGNGGDTLLVSIEQQQAATRRPQLNPTTTTTMSSFSDLTTAASTGFSSQPTEPTTSQPTTGSSQSYPYVPYIVIQVDRNDSSSFGQPHQKPARVGSSTHVDSVMSGSMSALAQASHGHQHNQQQHNNTSGQARPWPSSSSSSVSRHNSTGFMGGESSSNFTTGQPVDSIVGSDISSSGSSPSGSYQNHNQQQQQSSGYGQHIGMPHLGGSLASNNPGNRPNGSRRPSWWRISRRPGNNGSGSPSSSGAPYDFHSASSVSSNIYRPVLGSSLQQVLSLNTLAGLFDNVTIFFARLRTFLISLMVMFLPPLALAASVVNVMNS